MSQSQSASDAKLSPEELRKLPRQRHINVVAGYVIATHGPEGRTALCQYARDLAAMSLADPNHQEKQREFKRWCKAIETESDRLPDLDDYLTNDDRNYAAEMGIWFN